MAENDSQGTAPALSSDEVLIRAEGVVEAEVDGEQILLSPVDFSYFGLTGTGGHVWTLIDGVRSIDDIIDQLQSDYEADGDEIRDDVLSFVEALKLSGLVL